MARSPCPPVIPGTYHGRVSINGRPAPDGTLVVASVGNVKWGRAVTSGGRYVMDVPETLPTHPPCFDGGTVTFVSGGLLAAERLTWQPGLHYVDITFRGHPGPSTPPDDNAILSRARAQATAEHPVGSPMSPRATTQRAERRSPVSAEATETQYFVAHEFTPDKTDDLRRAIDEALADSGLTAYYADNEVRQGHILTEKIVPKIRSTRFGIYDLSNPDKPNVFIELGVAIGMAKPYLIICERGTKLPSDVLGLDRIEYESYVDLTRQLKAKVSKALRGEP